MLRLLALLAATTVALPAAAGSFRDDFDRLSRDRWYVSDGWTNGDWQNCTWSEEALALEDGRLRLEFQPVPRGERRYTCAEIQTRERFGHGTFEARMRTPRGSGLNSAFFTYIGPTNDAPHDEIDFEVLTRDPGQVSLTAYVSGEATSGRVVPVPGGADAGFRTYSFIWEPDRLRWYVDGVLVHEAQGADQLPKAAQKIFFSHWGTDTLTDWMGPFTDPGRTLALEVDWVAYTAPGEGCRFPESVLCAIEDE